MLTHPYFQGSSKGICALLLLCTFIGCNPSNSPEHLVHSAEAPTVIPNSIWISDAESWRDLSRRRDNPYSLYFTLNDTLANELKLLIGSDHSVYSADILGIPGIAHTLYFENDKIVFSLHIDSVAKIKWFLAYANEKPYAAAAKSGKEWEAIHLEDIPIDLHLIQHAEEVAKRYEKKEREHDYAYRILNKEKIIKGKLDSSFSVSYALNVRKNEHIHLSLTSSDSPIFFTVSPNNGSNMEHRNWDGIAKRTGDLNITVSSVKIASNQAFSLRVKRANPRNLISFEVPSGAREGRDERPINH